MDSTADARAEHREIYPQAFSDARSSVATAVYLRDPATQDLARFFRDKGLAALRDEEQREQWYEDWLTYQADHRIYASVLSPRAYSTIGASFDALRYARFLEVFAYFSPGHGYSVQVTSLGLFAILMGDNDALKREAVAALEAGKLLAFGVSERQHGSDLLANEFSIRQTSPGQFLANGSKYYIGNCNAAAIICTLARNETSRRGAATVRRAPMALFALRPAQATSFHVLRKIHTLGVRAAFVGEFSVKDYAFPGDDLIAQGRQAWDAVLGAVTLGKFFLSFGSIGICQRALQEAADHLRGRALYGKPVIAMPHIRLTLAHAWSRLAAMKLFAYRALDYVQSARPEDRRYLLYCAVQKARVSTEGVKVMSLLSECIGARGFETDTYFEMALRDIQLFPGLESSAHINLGLTAQFAPRYFAGFDRALIEPESLVARGTGGPENPFLFTTGAVAAHTVGFAPLFAAYRPLRAVANVRLFARQVRAFRSLYRDVVRAGVDPTEQCFAMALGQCLATIAYAQLIAEHARHLSLPGEVVSAIFHLLMIDLNAAIVAFTSLPTVQPRDQPGVRGLIAVPRTSQADWNFIASRMVGP